MKASSELLLLHVKADLDRHCIDSPEASWRQFAACTLEKTLLKKYLEKGSKESVVADNKALQLFLNVNEGLLDAPREAQTDIDRYLLGEVKNSLDRFWFRSGTDPLVSNLHQLFVNGRCGPGASLKVVENDFYTKLFKSHLTTTSSLLYDSYRASMDLGSYLHSDAENNRYESYGPAMVVSCSKLSFVPKRHDISRTICTEPVLNMYYQLGLAHILEKRLRQVYSLDLSTQPDFNRELARQGSVSGDFATIDLSSASDSLSVGVLRDILPKGMFSWLMALRTPATKLPDGRVVPLRMISTMGNGFTFPLETIVFAAVVEACYKLTGMNFVRNNDGRVGSFAVFGDDIIVRKESFRAVVRLLWLLGFTVNAEKTFVEGPFRESCGGDFYYGHHVRGVYIKSLETLQDRYVAINTLNDWSAQTGINLPAAIQYLVKTVKWVLIPPEFGLDAGIHVPLKLVPEAKLNINGSFKIRCYEARPRNRKIAANGHVKGRYVGPPNLSGLELAFIFGHVRSSTLSLRQRETEYSVKTRVSPMWDYISVARSKGRFCFTQWETAVCTNLLK